MTSTGRAQSCSSASTTISRPALVPEGYGSAGRLTAFRRGMIGVPSHATWTCAWPLRAPHAIPEPSRLEATPRERPLRAHGPSIAAGNALREIDNLGARGRRLRAGRAHRRGSPMCTAPPRPSRLPGRRLTKLADRPSPCSLRLEEGTVLTSDEHGPAQEGGRPCVHLLAMRSGPPCHATTKGRRSCRPRGGSI